MSRVLEDLVIKLQIYRNRRIDLTDDIKQLISDRYREDKTITNDINIIIIHDRFHKIGQDKIIKFTDIRELYPHYPSNYKICGSDKTFADYIREQDIVDIIDNKLADIGIIHSPTKNLFLKMNDEERHLLSTLNGNYGPIYNFNYQAEIEIKEFDVHTIRMIKLI